jgi:hypothetical protein
LDWQALIAAKNEELRQQGRNEISRFHAADFNSYRGDFHQRISAVGPAIDVSLIAPRPNDCPE